MTCEECKALCAGPWFSPAHLPSCRWHIDKCQPPVDNNKGGRS